MVTQDIFFEMHCLTEESKSLTSNHLIKKWFKKADRRFLEKLLFDFAEINKAQFQFLKITPLIKNIQGNVSILFRSDKYIGAIPLKSPDSGKQIGDFVVRPRYSEAKHANYIDLLYLLEGQIEPEFIDSLPLSSSKHIRPPLYFDCMVFIDLFIKLLSTHWQKFISETRKFSYPRAQIIWRKYIEKEWDPLHKLVFPCRINSLSMFHDELAKLAFVYKISKETINLAGTPLRIKSRYEPKIAYLEKLVGGVEPISTDKINIRLSDPFIVKSTKEQANKILQYQLRTNKAWRVDFSLVFEKYVQYIFKRVAYSSGARTINNPRIPREAISPPTWSLEHLEPDLLFLKKDFIITVDSKYKSNYYNYYSNNTLLKEDHRNDLHQILAYCSFEKTANKAGLLCYPSSEYIYKSINYHYSGGNTRNKIGLIGVPLDVSYVDETIKNISSEISKLY